MKLIDAHLHLFGDHPESIALLEKYDLLLLNICVNHQEAGSDWRSGERAVYSTLARRHPGRYAWCTTFDLPAPGEDPVRYAARVIQALDADLTSGAVACKVWKNVGMEWKDRDGRYLLVDDPMFEPFFSHLEQTGTPLLMHIAEPRACWRPLEEPGPPQAYYRANPQWHMLGRLDVPDHTANIRARDNMLARHPRLKAVGAHLGSLEYSLPEMAERFDRFPNYQIDTSARLGDLAHFDRDELIRFLEKYQDRVMFGTDAVSRQLHSTMTSERRSEMLQAYESNIQRHLRFFCTDEPLVIAGREVRGLALPEKIHRKIMHDNALIHYPGITRQTADC